jgi:hypothetical protein
MARCQSRAASGRSRVAPGFGLRPSSVAIHGGWHCFRQDLDIALLPNKLMVQPSDLDLEEWCCAGPFGVVALPLFFRHQGDGEGESWGVVLNQFAWWGSLAAASLEFTSRGRATAMAVLLRLFIVGRQLSKAMIQWLFNLLAVGHLGGLSTPAKDPTEVLSQVVRPRRQHRCSVRRVGPWSTCYGGEGFLGLGCFLHFSLGSFL